MTTARQRVWSWLMTAPPPRQPVRRIVSLSTVAVAVVFLSVVTGLPPSARVAVQRVLGLVILVMLGGFVVGMALLWRRGRSARAARRRRERRP